MLMKEAIVSMILMKTMVMHFLNVLLIERYGESYDHHFFYLKIVCAHNF